MYLALQRANEKQQSGSKRRRSVPHSMVMQQLALSEKVNSEMPNKRADLNEKECISTLADEIEIPDYRLRHFLEGDETCHINSKVHTETEGMLKDWLSGI